MSKIDELCAAVARIEQKVDGITPRLDKHSDQIACHERNLNGDGQTEGLNEWRRNFYRRHAFISALIPSGVLMAWEYAKYKMTGHW